MNHLVAANWGRRRAQSGVFSRKGVPGPSSGCTARRTIPPHAGRCEWEVVGARARESFFVGCLRRGVAAAGAAGEPAALRAAHDYRLRPANRSRLVGRLVRAGAEHRSSRLPPLAERSRAGATRREPERRERPRQRCGRKELAPERDDAGRAAGARRRTLGHDDDDVDAADAARRDGPPCRRCADDPSELLLPTPGLGRTRLGARSARPVSRVVDFADR